MVSTAATQSHPNRIAIVGVGNVGATFAYALLLSGLASEIANQVLKSRRGGRLRATPKQAQSPG